MNLKLSKNSNVIVFSYIDKVYDKKTMSEFFYSLSMQSHDVDLVILHKNLTEEQQNSISNFAEQPEIEVVEKDYLDLSQNKLNTFRSSKLINMRFEQVDLKSFPDLFNLCFQEAKENEYEYFSICEPEDVYSVNWFQTAIDYSKENPEVAIFTPIIRNFVNGIMQGYFNEAPWAEGMSQEAGKYDSDLLSKFNCLTPLGALYSVSLMDSAEEGFREEEGKKYFMKSNIKLTSSYEFFNRAVYNSFKIMNIPRMGYELRTKHLENYDPISVKVPSNILSIPKEKGGFSKQEADFWLRKATDSYFYEIDEEIIYEGE